MSSNGTARPYGGRIGRRRCDVTFAGPDTSTTRGVERDTLADEFERARPRLRAVAYRMLGSILDRTPDAARQLASRARRRVGRTPREPDADLAVQREVVDAFLAAARSGDFDGLLSILDPEVALHTDGGGSGPLARPAIAGARA